MSKILTFILKSNPIFPLTHTHTHTHRHTHSLSLSSWAGSKPRSLTVGWRPAMETPLQPPLTPSAIAPDNQPANLTAAHQTAVQVARGQTGQQAFRQRRRPGAGPRGLWRHPEEEAMVLCSSSAGGGWSLMRLLVWRVSVACWTAAHWIQHINIHQTGKPAGTVFRCTAVSEHTTESVRECNWVHLLRWCT